MSTSIVHRGSAVCTRLRNAFNSDGEKQFEGYFPLVYHLQHCDKYEMRTYIFGDTGHSFLDIVLAVRNAA